MTAPNLNTMAKLPELVKTAAEWSLLDLPVLIKFYPDNKDEIAASDRVFSRLITMEGGETISIGLKSFTVVCQKTYIIEFGSNNHGLILRDEKGTNHHIAYDLLAFSIAPEKYGYTKRVSYTEVSF
jgi:hypothetical protein